MIFDTSSNNIILISYPSGGFGNFIYYILTKFADQTVKVPNIGFNLSVDGDSHATTKYTEIYYQDPAEYIPNISVDPKDKKILVLCDNGILNDKYSKIKIVFPMATIVRIVINLAVRPVIYQTCIVKAMKKDMNTINQYHIDGNWSDADTDYAQRENFTLFYHHWPFEWQESADTINLSLEDLIIDPIETIIKLINRLGMQLVDKDLLRPVINDWLTANAEYFSVYWSTKTIMQALESKKHIDISNIVDLHEQGYINYCIEAKYHVTIPVYDYKDWFKSTLEISNMIEKLHV
jgi:hypothetical protein